MSLTTPSDYERLGENLTEIDHLFFNFLRNHNYKNNTGALGRHPHRSAVQYGAVNRKIDLQMQADTQGMQNDEFGSIVRYSLWAGAWLDEGENRHSIPGFIIFENTPYQDMRKYLKSSLERANTKLLSIDRGYLLDHGRMSRLSQP